MWKLHSFLPFTALIQALGSPSQFNLLDIIVMILKRRYAEVSYVYHNVDDTNNLDSMRYHRNVLGNQDDYMAICVKGIKCSK